MCLWYCFRIRLFLCLGRYVVVFGIDFEEVVENDKEHGQRSKEDSEGVEVVVGDHGDGDMGTLRNLAVMNVGTGMEVCWYH